MGLLVFISPSFSPRQSTHPPVRAPLHSLPRDIDPISSTIYPLDHTKLSRHIFTTTVLLRVLICVTTMFTLVRLVLLLVPVLIPFALAHPMLEMSDYRGGLGGGQHLWGADRIRALRHVDGERGMTYLSSSAQPGMPASRMIVFRGSL